MTEGAVIAIATAALGPAGLVAWFKWPKDRENLVAQTADAQVKTAMMILDDYKLQNSELRKEMATEVAALQVQLDRITKQLALVTTERDELSFQVQGLNREVERLRGEVGS